ncbi:hypothetical protein TWF730_010265 [Orbilia blumenaviensis]|uniref:Uncharacterized protein n=1 Tax=Orbilia blumenaviensis TaxID=1796055 RepID=A0AAV9UR88_9PEZI
MEETKQGIGPWAGLPPSKDPASPHYIYHPEHERLSSLSPSVITTPPLTPALPAFIAYWTGMYNMYGVRGRDSVYIVAMRRRAEIIPRPFTQAEHAILGRYSQNMQNGAEYFGLLGLAGGIYWSTRTEFWPMEKSFRTMFGMKGGAAPAEQFPPSGFVYPNGWGQKEGGGGGNAGSGAGVGAGSGTGAPTGVPPESAAAEGTTNNASGRPTRIQLEKITPEAMRGPQIEPVKATFNYSLSSRIQRWLYMAQCPPQLMINQIMKQKSRLDGVDPNSRDTARYKIMRDRIERMASGFQDFEKSPFNRIEIRKDVAEELKKVKELPAELEAVQLRVKELESLLKEFDEFDRRLTEARKTWTGGAAGTAGEAAASASSAASEAAANAARKAEFAEELAKAEAEARATLSQKAPESSSHSSGPSRPGAPGTGPPQFIRVYHFNPVRNLKDFIRAGVWGFFGKYTVGTLGLIWLTSRSRQKEIADERLQEYNYDRMEYAKVRMKETMSRRGLPIPQQPQPQPEPRDSDDGGSGSSSRQPERFEPVDTQSLGGLQSEGIDWGDYVKDDAPAAARKQENGPVMPPLRPGESSWDRARRAREGPQGPAMEEDRWAPQAQQDTAVKTDDMANMSTWERIRQQASEGYGGERRVPGENRDGGEGNTSFGGFGRRQQGQDRQKTREELQKEFDAQVEKDRRGEDGAWK